MGKKSANAAEGSKKPPVAKGRRKMGKKASPNHSGQGKAVATSEAVATKQELEKLWHDSGGRCALTGEALSFDVATVDHIVSVYCGGSHTVDNLQIVHEQVNNMKGPLSNEEFLARVKQIYEHSCKGDA